jgi:GNAT superfamily N-acetyltransferase
MRIEYLPKDERTIHQVAAWLYSEWGHVTPGSTLARGVARISERADRRTIPLAFVARAGCVSVGTASLVFHDLQIRTDLSPWMSSVYVLASYRRRGIGAALCRRVAREARGLGLGRIYLYTPDKAAFYASLGWKEIQQPDYRGKKVTVMALG